MKKIFSCLLIFVFVLIVVTGCSDNESNSQNGTQNTTARTTAATTSKSDSSGITKANVAGIQITVRMDLSGTDAAVSQEYYKVEDLTWDGLAFSGSAGYKKEIRYRGNNYDVNENVEISGKVSSDGKVIESIAVTNERDFIDHTDMVIEQEFEFSDIPLKDPDQPNDFNFHRRENAQDATKILKLWLEKEPRSEDVTLETMLDQFTKHNQDIEVSIFFYD